MRIRLTSLLLLTSFTVFAQTDETDHAETAAKCRSHARAGRVARPDFYQSPQMDRYDVKYLKLDVSLTPGSTSVAGSARYLVRVKQAIDSFTMEFRANMTLDSVYLNGVKRSFVRLGDHVYVPLSPSLAPGSMAEIVWYYKGLASGSAIFAGSVASNGLVYSASLSESYQAREWYPAKQILTDKMDSLDMWITCDPQFKAGSNGVLKEIVDVPGSKKQYRWSCRYPINYYLPSVAVGNYQDYRNYAKPVMLPNDSILVQHYVVDNATYLASVKTNLDNTPRFIEKLSELYSLYPFYKEKYGHCHANIGGGMEHQTMSTMAGFSNNLITHELGHQWFGDNVTCATWNHIWLNEGFASYSEYLCQEKLPAIFGANAAASTMNSVHNSVMSSATGSVFVPDASLYDENRIFSSRLSYNKGSAIIHILRGEMQDDTLFFRTLRTFQSRFKDSTATADDFKAVAEEICGRSFSGFFNQWYKGEGFPTYSADYTKQGNNLILTVTHTTSAPAITPLFTGLLEVTIQSAQGDTTVKLNITANNQQFTIPYTKTPGGLIIDPKNWIINRVGSITTAVSNINNNDPSVKIAPNPARNKALLQFKAGQFTQVEIFNTAGERMAVYSIGNSANQLNIATPFPSGTYTVKLNGKNKTTVKRLVVSW